MEQGRADERRVVARPVELCRQFVAVIVASVGDMWCAACNAYEFL